MLRNSENPAVTHLWHYRDSVGFHYYRQLSIVGNDDVDTLVIPPNMANDDLTVTETEK